MKNKIFEYLRLNYNEYIIDILKNNILTIDILDDVILKIFRYNRIQILYYLLINDKINIHYRIYYCSLYIEKRHYDNIIIDDIIPIFYELNYKLNYTDLYYIGEKISRYNELNINYKKFIKNKSLNELYYEPKRIK